MTGAGCGDWTDAESAQTLRPCTNMDVSKIKGEEGDVNTCKRCAGKVKIDIFERHFSKKNTYPAFLEVFRTFKEFVIWIHQSWIPNLQIF